MSNALAPTTRAALHAEASDLRARLAHAEAERAAAQQALARAHATIRQVTVAVRLAHALRSLACASATSVDRPPTGG